MVVSWTVCYTCLFFLGRTMVWGLMPPAGITGSRTSQFWLPPVSLSISGNQEAEATSNTDGRFPVLSKIAGENWQGSCRYIGEDLNAKPLELSGGIRFDLGMSVVELNSFLVFPNGKRREIVMRGNPESSIMPPLRLDPTSSEGPIYTVLFEVQPDTIVINEYEKATGNMVMSSSLSLVAGESLSFEPITELIQVSHEVRSSTSPNATESDGGVIKGYQIWRFSKT